MKKISFLVLLNVALVSSLFAEHPPVPPNKDEISKQIDNYQQINFIKNDSFISCLGEECNIDILPKDSFSLFVLGSTTSYKIFYREQSNLDKVYLWESTSPIWRQDKSIVWPEEEILKYKNQPRTLTRSEIKVLEDIIMYLFKVQTNYSLTFNTYLTCKQYDCFKNVSKDKLWMEEARKLGAFNENIEYECRGNPESYNVWIRYKDFPNRIFKSNNNAMFESTLGWLDEYMGRSPY